MFWHAASAVCRPGGDPGSMAAAAAGSGIEPALSTQLCWSYAACRALLSLRRTRTWLQHQPDSHRFDVQHGVDSNDLFWVYLLSLERAGALSYPAEDCPGESSRLCQRRS